VRREALACLASVLIAGLSLQSVKAADRLNTIYPSISGLVLGLWITKEAKLFDKHGLDVNSVYIQSASAVMQAMLGGKAPVALPGGKPWWTWVWRLATGFRKYLGTANIPGQSEPGPRISETKALSESSNKAAFTANDGNVGF
jgi:ABC-type nitrate/sulfonate/bicarbonate transport system substrate-binding protein